MESVTGSQHEMILNVPAELRERNQWCYTDVSNSNGNGNTPKSPRNPYTHELAKANDPETWGAFGAASRAVKIQESKNKTSSCRFGYVLSKDDEFTVIDLDLPKVDTIEGGKKVKKHITKTSDIKKWDSFCEDMINRFDSYTERSQSGKGYHIVIKGKMKGEMLNSEQGTLKRKHSISGFPVEVFSHSRFVICTGNVLLDKPISERQDELDTLVKELTTTPAIHKRPQATPPVPSPALIEDDEVIIEKACKTEFGEKFEALLGGNIEGFVSPSEADWAFIKDLCRQTESDEQVVRIYRSTPLVLNREWKAGRSEYLHGTINKARGKLAEEAAEKLAKEADVRQAYVNRAAESVAKIDSTKLADSEMDRESYEAAMAEVEMDKKKIAAPQMEYPDGLVGETATYIRENGRYKCHVAGITAALGIMAGICGRAYNVSQAGLNLYLILIARSGSGKESMSTGLSYIKSAIAAKNRSGVDVSGNFRRPTNINDLLLTKEFASGAALHREIVERPSFVTQFSEFGGLYQRMCSLRAPDHLSSLRDALITLYSASGAHREYTSKSRADKKHDVEGVKSPSISLLCEARPSSLFDSLELTDIISGLIPRFVIIENTEPLPNQNRNPQELPNSKLVTRYLPLVKAACDHNDYGKAVIDVQYSADAEKLRWEFSDATSSKRRAGERPDASPVEEAIGVIWNRAELNVSKIAALVTLGMGNTSKPIIEKSTLEWAIKFVTNSVEILIDRVKSGEYGSDAVRQMNTLRRIVKSWLAKSTSSRKKYGYATPVSEGKVIPYNYIKNSLMASPSVNGNKLFTLKLVEDIIHSAVSSEIIDVADPFEYPPCRSTTKIYKVGANFTKR